MALRFAKILFGFIILIQIASCERRTCTDVVCGVNQQCSQGNCYCQDGYEGSNCNTESAQKYVGNYNVSEACYSSTSNFFNYTCYITADPFYINRVQINNLFGQTTATGVIHTDQNNLGNYISACVCFQSIFGTLPPAVVPKSHTSGLPGGSITKEQAEAIINALAK